MNRFRLSFTAFLSLLSAAPALEVRVSSTITPQQALTQIREARKAGDTSPATLVFPAGTTELLTPLTLEAQDSNLTLTGQKLSDTLPLIASGEVSLPR